MRDMAKSLFGKSRVSISAHEIGAHGDEDGGIEKLFVDMPWRVISGFWRFD